MPWTGRSTRRCPPRARSRGMNSRCNWRGTQRAKRCLVQEVEMTEVRDAAATIVGQRAMPTAGIGAPVRRQEGRAKVTGEATYASEERPPSTLHAVMVGSTIAAGRLTRIDAKAAGSLPGVVAVLTHDDMPKLAPPPVPPAAQSFTPMQGTEIHYEGQPVALVLAETLEAAEEGAALVRASYRRTDQVALDNGAERVPRRENKGNAYWDFDTHKAD